MSRTIQGLASRALLSITLILASTQVHVFAQSYTWRNVQIFGGGFIVGVVFNQTEPNLVYTRTDIGGAYRLDNATGRWVPLLDSISWESKVTSFPNPGNFVQDPTDPNNYLTDSIFRSIDAGQSWVRINDDQHQWGRAGETAITGDPRIFGRVYIGTNGRGVIYGDGQ